MAECNTSPPEKQGQLCPVESSRPCCQQEVLHLVQQALGHYQHGDVLVTGWDALILLLKAAASSFSCCRYLWGAAEESQRHSHRAAALQKAHAGKGAVLSLAPLPGHRAVCPQGGLQFLSVP